MKARICHFFPTFGPGGSQARTRKLIEATADRFDHTVVALDGDLRSADPMVDLRGFHARPAPTGARGRLPHRALFGELRRLRPDVVATYNWGAMDVVTTAAMMGIPVIHHEDGFNPDEMHGQKSRRVWARRLLLRHTQRVVVPSGTLRSIAASTWRVRPEQLTFIPNGIDTDRFRPGIDEAVREHLGLGPRDRLVGTVGHLNTAKNISMLVRAVGTANNRLPVDLVILGEGAERRQLERLASSLHIAERVHLVGHITDPAPWYRAMDLFAMSSRTEQMPVSILEAMASGLPVVATDVGDTRQMLAPENRRFVVSRDDGAGFATVLSELLRNGPLRHALGDANRTRACERFDESEMIAAHESVWASALSDGVRRRASGRRAAA